MTELEAQPRSPSCSRTSMHSYGEASGCAQRSGRSTNGWTRRSFSAARR